MKTINLNDTDINALLSCNTRSVKNYDYAETIMRILERYQLLDDGDLDLLVSRDKCRELFKSDYAILRKIDTNIAVSEQVKDRTGRNRI